MDVTEYGLVTRFGRVVRVVTAPGLYIAAPFDRVVRLDKRMLFSRAASSEYLTIDKKNVVVESSCDLADRRPASASSARSRPRPLPSRIGDIVLGEIGPFTGRIRPPLFVSADAAESSIGRSSPRWASFRGFRRQRLWHRGGQLDIRHMSLPEQNREHVFDRMKAERGKIAKENRSAGELEAKEISLGRTTRRRISRRRRRLSRSASTPKAMRRPRASTPPRSAGREVLQIPAHPPRVRQFMDDKTTCSAR